MDEAWRSIQDPSGNRDRKANDEIWEKQQEDLFGFNFKDKIQEFKPRYKPAVQEVMRSEEVKAEKDFYMNEALNDFMVHKIMRQA